MRVRHLLIPIAAFLTVVSFLVPVDRQSAWADGWWLSDYALALKQAEETGKPILVGFR